MYFKQKVPLLISILVLFGLGCGLAQPVQDGLSSIAQPAETATPTFTPRPTFTATPAPTDTPTLTFTPSPTLTPIPTNTPAPTDTPIPTDTFTPSPPTNTPVPTATFTPEPPTITPTPSYPFKVVEGPAYFQTTNSWLVILIAATDGNNVPIGNLKVVGDHSPSGLHHESGETCFDFCKYSGLAGTVKWGNVSFEPPRYETGVWNLYLVDGAGNQVSDLISVGVDFNSPGWYFIRLSS